MRGFWIIAGILSTATAIAGASAVDAQTSDQVVVMRRVVAPPKKAMTGTSYEQSVFHWEIGPWETAGGSACSSTADQTRPVGCVKNYMAQPDSACPQPKPDVSQQAPDYSSCGYAWTITGYGAWSSNCSRNAVRQTISVCTRSDGTNVDDALCSNSPKPTNQSGDSSSGCSYTWVIGDWNDFSPTCSDAAVRSREVVCRRSDGTDAANGFCPAPVPESQQTQGVYTGCTFIWQAGPWIDPPNACSASTTETRTITCVRADKPTEKLDPSSCSTISPPATSQVVAVDSGCSFDWVTTDWSDWSSSCSNSATRTRAASCQRSDGTPADYSKCNPATLPATNDIGAVTTGCTYDWKPGAWTVTPSCSATAPEGRSIACTRSDGTTADDTLCDPASKPPATDTTADYSACGYKWVTGDWTPYDNVCSDTATRTRTVSCQRSDGTTVDGSLCGTDSPPGTTDTSGNYVGCAYQWTTGDWTDFNSTCSAHAMRTRTTTCLRTINGQQIAVDNANCSALPQPPATDSEAVYTSCPSVWIAGAWSTPPANTCNSSYTETETPTCQATLPDGTKATVADSQCDPASKPPTTQQADVSTGCTWNWYTGPYGSFNSTCSQKAQRTRTVYCYRSDAPSTAVSDSFCSSAGTKPQTVDTEQNVTDCGGTLTNGNFEQGTLAGWTLTHTTNSRGVGSNPSIQNDVRHGGSYAMGFPSTSTGDGAFSSIATQSFTTKAGVSYAVSAWGYCFGAYCASMQVLNSSGGVVSSASFNNGSSNGIWTQKSLSVAGDGSTMSVRFLSTNVGTSAPRIDDVVVSATPPAN